VLQEPEVERSEHEDDANVYRQPFPEVVSEEQDVDSDHDGYQRHHEKPSRYRSSHSRFPT